MQEKKRTTSVMNEPGRHHRTKIFAREPVSQFPIVDRLGQKHYYQGSMNYERTYTRPLPPIGKPKAELSYARRWVSESSKIIPIIIIPLLFASVITIISPVRAFPQQGEPGATVEGFTLFRYDEDLTWKLSGKKADERGESLIVHEFELVIRRAGSEGGDTVYELSGEKIRLNAGDKKEIGVIPGEVKVNIENELRGRAGSASYDFRTGMVSGSELNLTGAGKGDNISLKGASFEYRYGKDKLLLTGGFRVTIKEAGNGRTEISGDRLTWIRGEKIFTKGAVSASTDSGWTITAEEMVWDPDGEVLECSGNVVATREDTRVQGQSLTYDVEGNKLSVVEAKMVVKGN
ncbi:MAG: hypothetical protein ABEJ25_02695 [Candidatus Bipolaricaulia bacterium]